MTRQNSRHAAKSSLKLFVPIFALAVLSALPCRAEIQIYQTEFEPVIIDPSQPDFMAELQQPPPVEPEPAQEIPVEPQPEVPAEPQPEAPAPAEAAAEPAPEAAVTAELPVEAQPETSIPAEVQPEVPTETATPTEPSPEPPTETPAEESNEPRPWPNTDDIQQPIEDQPVQQVP